MRIQDCLPQIGDYRTFIMEDGSRRTLGGLAARVMPHDMRVKEAKPGWSVVKLPDGWTVCVPPDDEDGA